MPKKLLSMKAITQLYYLKALASGLAHKALSIWGVNMGLLPTKGLTLPLLSFGGSGILANIIAIAILLRIDWENRRGLRGI